MVSDPPNFLSSNKRMLKTPVSDSNSTVVPTKGDSGGIKQLPIRGRVRTRKYTRKDAQDWRGRIFLWLI